MLCIYRLYAIKALFLKVIYSVTVTFFDNFYFLDLTYLLYFNGWVVAENGNTIL